MLLGSQSAGREGSPSVTTGSRTRRGGGERGGEGRDAPGQAVAPVPEGDPEGLLLTTVPGGGDEGEEGEARGLEETEEEAAGEDRAVRGGAGETDGGDAPAEDERRHLEGRWTDGGGGQVGGRAISLWRGFQREGSKEMSQRGTKREEL